MTKYICWGIDPDPKVAIQDLYDEVTEGGGKPWEADSLEDAWNQAVERGWNAVVVTEIEK